MKYQTYYKHLERRVFTFNKGDVLAALKDKAEGAPFGASSLPTGAASATWEMDIDLYEGDDYKPTVTLTQTFEYPVSTMPNGTPASDAVGQPSTDAPGAITRAPNSSSSSSS